MKDTLENITVIGLWGLVIGFCVWGLWIVPKQQTAECKIYFGPQSRIVYTGRNSEPGCLYPDGTLRYLPR